MDGGLSLDEAERLSKLINDHMQAVDLGEYEWRAQRYLNALWRRSGEILGCWKELKQVISRSVLARNT